MTYSLARLREHLEKNAGETGFKIFQTSAARLRIGVEPSPEQINKLTKEIEKNLILFFGNTRTKEILEKLEQESIEAEALFKSDINQALETLFTTKGIPSESDLMEISRYILTKGYDEDEKIAVDTLKQLSKEKVLSALNESIVRYEVQRFIDKYPSFKTADIGNFIDYIKNKKLETDSEIIINMIERERLYRKFEEQSREENLQEMISKQYISLLNSSKSSDFKYLMVDEKLTSFLLKNIQK